MVSITENLLSPLRVTKTKRPLGVTATPEGWLTPIAMEVTSENGVAVSMTSTVVAPVAKARSKNTFTSKLVTLTPIPAVLAVVPSSTHTSKVKSVDRVLAAEGVPVTTPVEEATTKLVGKVPTRAAGQFPWTAGGTFHIKPPVPPVAAKVNSGAA